MTLASALGSVQVVLMYNAIYGDDRAGASDGVGLPYFSHMHGPHAGAKCVARRSRYYWLGRGQWRVDSDGGVSIQ